MADAPVSDADVVKRIEQLLTVTPDVGYRVLHASLVAEPEFKGVGLKRVQKLLSELKARAVENTGGYAVKVPQKKKTADGIGPGLMVGQAGLLNRLLALVGEVDALRDEDKREERNETNIRVEEELIQIEAVVDKDTPMGQQHMSLIALVRSALVADREGKEASNKWEEQFTDEALRKDHGLVTYATPEYWNKAYAGKKYGETFDWYSSWEKPDKLGKSLKGLVKPLLSTESKILVLGCGNSNMSAQMYNEGFKSIVNIDIAPGVIATMRKKYAKLRGMLWQAMDATAMTFPDNHFDAVIDKGTFDALFAGTAVNVGAVVGEIQRVLKPGGQLISVTHSASRSARLQEHGSENEQKCECNQVGELQRPDEEDDKTKQGEEKKGIFVYSFTWAS